MFKFFVLSAFAFLFHLPAAISQSQTLQQITGLPTTEVYDLFTDSKGFLWIGHSGGVSKYDGINFTNYSNPQQSSLNAAGFIEDKYGRIWFNNFTGQIFYIENGRMCLLTAYEGKNEPGFPRIGLLNDLLVATTQKGLFVCDINTLKCHYETCKNLPGTGTASLSVLSGKVIAYGYRRWLIYEPGKGLSPAYFNEHDAKIMDENVGTLNMRTFKDTIFFFCNPSRIVYKLAAFNDSLKVCSEQHFKYYINTVTVENKGYWVNTARFSIEKPGNNIVAGYNLNALTADKQGHHWYASLQKGLLTNTESETAPAKPGSLTLQKGDVITCAIKNGSTLLIGTEYGKLFSYDPYRNKSILLTELLSKHNGIRFLKTLDSNTVLIGSTSNTFIFRISDHHTERTYRYLSVKQADTICNSIVFATSSGLIALPGRSPRGNYELWKTGFYKNFSGFSEKEESDGPYKFLVYNQRAIAVCCLPKTQAIWAALKNGLYEINKHGIVPYYLDNSPVYASCLTAYHNKVIAGTFNNGVLIIDGGKIKSLSTEDGLLSNHILRLKIINECLWIYNSGLIQVFNLNTLKIINKYELPGINDNIATDADEINGQPFVVNVNGVYKITAAQKNDLTGIYLNSLTINGRDTGIVNNVTLRYNQNNVQINLGIPSLLNSREFTIKYRLLINGYSKWIFGKAFERNFRFSSLMPGSYQFEAFAYRPQTGIASRIIKINFIIMFPWWQRWWAIACMAAIGALIIYSVSRLYYTNVLASKKSEYEKNLAIERERQRISSDMHDDIGASLSAIKLYTGSIKHSTEDSGGISDVYKMVSELSDKTREVIWSLNNEYDTLENLIFFIDSTAFKLFEHSGIKLKTAFADNIPEIIINNDQRRDVFLIMKEIMHNILKHAKATEVSLKFDVVSRHLIIETHDNGIGFQKSRTDNIKGLGLTNIKKRIQNLGGEVLVETGNGTVINLKIPFFQPGLAYRKSKT